MMLGQISHVLGGFNIMGLVIVLSCPLWQS